MTVAVMAQFSQADAAVQGDWRDAGGQPLTCAEKRKVLDDLMQELEAQYRDAFDDALLLGCGIESFRHNVQERLAAIQPSVKERR